MCEFNGKHISIDVVHAISPSSPSVRNLKQGLSNLDCSESIKYYSLKGNIEINRQGVNKIINGFASVPNGIQSFYQLHEDRDVLIIHKSLTPIDFPILERLFTQHQRTIYSTYDADYITKPRTVNYLFDQVDLVWATSREIENKAKEFNDNVRLIPPSVDIEIFNPIDIKDDYKYITQSDKIDITLGWVGNAAVHQDNLELLANQIEMASIDHTVCLRALTGGVNIPNSTFTKLSRAFDNIEIIDWVPYMEVPRIINTFDIGIAPLRNTPKYRGCSSEKIREYMACGLPVIASNVGENPYLIPEDAGYLVDDFDDWSKAINTLANNPEMRSLMGEQARRHVVSNYSINKITKDISDMVVDLAK